MEKRTNREVLEQFLDLPGKTIIDVGCGDGSLVRLLTRKGAHATGIEASPKQLALARAAETVGDERYIQGCVARGQRAGDVKHVFLRRELDWRRHMTGAARADSPAEEVLA